MLSKTLSSQEIEEIFSEVFNGQRNIMTPGVVEYAQLTPDTIYELSYGEGPITHKTLYGVTFLHLGELGEWDDRDLSKDQVFLTLKEAKEYLEEVKNNHTSAKEE